MNQEIEGIQEIRSKAVNYALLSTALLAVPALITSLVRVAEIG